MRKLTPSLAVLSTLVLAACNGENTVTVSARLGTAPQGLTGQAVTGGVRQGLAAAASPTVQLTRVRMVVRRVKLERKSGGVELEVASGPYLVDVSGEAMGNIRRQFELDVPAGSYHELKFDIHKLEDRTALQDPALEELRRRRASIVVDGTIDGEAFTFTSDLDETQRFEGDFEVGGSTDNLTLDIAPSGWFTTADGQFLDPRQESNRDAIENNIERSIDVFEDDDGNGSRDDHGGRRDGGDDDAGDDHGGQRDGGDDDAGDDHGGRRDGGDDEGGGRDGGDDHGGDRG